jgi:ribosomal protein S18 acetylase RimI-like enzyme
MIIRDYVEGDYQELVKMMDGFNSYIASVDTKKIVRSFASKDEAEAYTNQTIKDAMEKDGFIYIAEENDRIVGFIQGIIDKNDSDVLYKLSHIPFYDGWIGEFYIIPEFRGTGLGRQLMDKAYEYFKSKNCRYFRLLVMKDNENAINVYGKMGFETRDLELLKKL